MNENSTAMYDGTEMDPQIERDVDELRAMLADVPGPSEPHPAYWNNFLIRVRTRIDADSVPQGRPWWSPSLIWGSLTGVALLLIAAWSIGIFPFGTGDDLGSPTIADASIATAAVEDPLTLTPAPQIDESTINDPVFALAGMTEETESSAPLTRQVHGESLVMTPEDIAMLDAIQADDDEAILEAVMLEI